MVLHIESWVILPASSEQHNPVMNQARSVQSSRRLLCLAEHLHVKPGKGAAFVRTKLKNSITSNTIDKTFRAGETVASATVEKKDSQFTYADGAEVSPLLHAASCIAFW